MTFKMFRHAFCVFGLLLFSLTACKDGIVMAPPSQFDKPVLEEPQKPMTEAEYTSVMNLVERKLHFPYIPHLIGGSIGLWLLSKLLGRIYELTTTSDYSR